jgi:hypothetical protein
VVLPSSPGCRPAKSVFPCCSTRSDRSGRAGRSVVSLGADRLKVNRSDGTGRTGVAVLSGGTGRSGPVGPAGPVWFVDGGFTLVRD